MWKEIPFSTEVTDGQLTGRTHSTNVIYLACSVENVD